MIKETTILLVEDDENLGALITEGLKEEGYTVIWEKSGIQAYSKFKKEPPSLAILDVMLPDIDGFELAQKIREIDPRNFGSEYESITLILQIDQWKATVRTRLQALIHLQQAVDFALQIPKRIPALSPAEDRHT